MRNSNQDRKQYLIGLPPGKRTRTPDALPNFGGPGKRLSGLFCAPGLVGSVSGMV